MRIPVIYDDKGKKEYVVEEPDPLEQPVEQVVMAAEPVPAAPPEADYRDLYLRAMADMANFRRRTEERARDQVEEERRRLLKGFLEFADNLERALAHLDEPGLRQGVQLTWEGLRRFLQREGVEPIEAKGQPFDPQVHEAVSVVEGAGEAGQVVEEVQRGYRIHGRLLRPARVQVGR